MSLRAVITSILVALTIGAIAVSLALVVFTTRLHQTTGDMRSALGSIETAHALERRLLLHARATDPLVRVNLERQLLTDLTTMERLATSPEERRLVSSVRERLGAYLALPLGAPDAAAMLTASFEQIVRLRRLNVDQAEAMAESSARWNIAADVIGAAVAAMLLGGLALAVVWLRWRALIPIVNIGKTMERFARGERDARVPETGARELCLVASRFNEVADALEDERKSRLAFLAGVAHEIRNPLGALAGGLDLLERDPGGARTPERLALVKRQVHRLDRLVTDLLDAARGEAGVLDIRLRECDLGAVAREAIDLVRPVAPGHAFRLQLPEEPLPVRGDPERLSQVMSNLLSNAIKYSPAGGDIEVRLAAEGDAAVLDVVDHGIGIAPEDREAVFAPFRRGRSARDTAPGTGIGLPMARRIVEAHGGRIEMATEVGRGSRFTVILPRGAEERPAQP